MLQVAHMKGVRMPKIQIQIPETQIKDFCQKYHVREFQLFGSVLREDFKPDSDVDVLLTFEENGHYSLFDLERMQQELDAILGRKVDMVEKSSVEMSGNYIRRKHILQSSVPIYVA
jgi:predicted nucleotidyltransferase